MAEDLILFSNRGYVELSDDYASTSSIMPQKKNPDTLELVRATAGGASAGLNGLLTTLKGLPRAYNRDLQRATPHAWEAVDAVSEATDVAAGAVATAEWDGSSLAAAAGEGFSTATGVADALATEGLPFRTAHELVARASENGNDYAALEAAAEELLDEPLDAHVSQETIEAALDPAESVASRDSRGGPAPAAVRGRIDGVRNGIAADRERIAELRSALEAANDALAAEVRTYG
jgi:argininosuccinate lyase